MFKRIAIPLLVFGVLLGIGGCTASNSTQLATQHEVKPQETIAVTKASITPTYSFNATAGIDATFTINAPAKGVFLSDIRLGSQVNPDSILGKLNDAVLKTQVNALVKQVASSGLEYPRHYPLLALQYPGYAFKTILPPHFSSILSDGTLSAKFQIQDKKPEDIEAIYLSYENLAPEDDTSSSKATPVVSALLLVPKDADVHPGERALVVLKGEVRKDVLVLPLTCLAGREGEALVLVKDTDGSFVQKSVQLGATDGAMTEIVSGLSEGDEVCAIAPNIDPRMQ